MNTAIPLGQKPFYLPHLPTNEPVTARSHPAHARELKSLTRHLLENWHATCAPVSQVQKEMEFFDIFVRFDGKLRWIECVEGLAVARQHAICFSERFLGESLIYSERDGIIYKAH